MDWQQRWIEGVTPWDLKQVTPPLRTLLREGVLAARGVPAPARVAIPGCGRGHDLKAFVQAGYRAVGFDLVPEAVREARALLALNEVPEPDPEDPSKPAAEVFCRDLLGLEEAWDRQFRVVFDYTCLCALRPQLRVRYVDAMARLLEAGGLFLHLAFPMSVERAGSDGPPYLLEHEMLLGLFGQRFELVETREPVGSVPSRLGAERFYVWRLRAGG